MVTKAGVELKVGFFVLVGLVILVVVLFSIGDFYLLNPGYRIKATFGFANGVDVGAPVRLAGVDVGEVKDVRIFYDENLNRLRAEISIWIKRGVNIPKDSQVRINTLGLLGEKYVEISPGVSTIEFLKPGDSVAGKDPIPMEAVTELSYSIATKLNEGVDSLKEVVEDKQLQESFKAAIGDLKEVTASAKVILGRIEKGEGTLGKLLTDDKLYTELESLVEDLKRHPWKLLHKPREKK